MRKLIYILALIPFLGISQLSAPLSGNANPELITGNALLFINEVDSNSNFVYVGDPAHVISVAASTAYGTSFAIQYTVPADGNSIETLDLATASANEEFDWAILIKKVSGQGFATIRWKINGVIKTDIDVFEPGWSLYSNAPALPETGEALVDATGGAVRLNIYGSKAGDVFQIKASLKRR